MWPRLALRTAKATSCPSFWCEGRAAPTPAMNTLTPSQHTRPAGASGPLLRPFEGMELAAERHAPAGARQIAPPQWTYAEMLDCSRRLAAQLAEDSCRPSAAADTAAQAGMEVQLLGNEALGAMQSLLPVATGVRRVVAPPSLMEAEPATGSAPQAAARVLRDARHLAQPARWLPPARRDDPDRACLLNTSGSTSSPKGVAITFELRFDVALHDLLNAWWSGATRLVMPERAMLEPARFIIEQRISVWFSVASFAKLMHKQRMLLPWLFNHLRLSLLCGEALPMATVRSAPATQPAELLECAR
jgi:hypothetical protein